ncbi:MAG: hypothetical protein ACYTDY_15630, partial [Planctomycetota bacterium]
MFGEEEAAERAVPVGELLVALEGDGGDAGVELLGVFALLWRAPFGEEGEAGEDLRDRPRLGEAGLDVFERLLRGLFLLRGGRREQEKREDGQTGFHPGVPGYLLPVRRALPQRNCNLRQARREDVSISQRVGMWSARALRTARIARKTSVPK